MSITLTTQEVGKIARLARLTLTDEELVLYQKQLSSILEFVSKLQKIKPKKDLQKIQRSGLTNVFREDKLDTRRQLTQGAALKNAKASFKGYFKVSAVLGEQE